jgi:DNA-binding NtrC family response regulator
MNSEKPPFSSAAFRSNGQILVVDDEPHVLTMACTMLDSQGFKVTGCHSGEAALVLIESAMQLPAPFSVLVLDLTLPGGMSGFDTLEAVQRLDPNMAVIACSGYFQEDARDLCQAIGFADILQKPYSIESLCAIVRRCLARDKTSAYAQV